MGHGADLDSPFAYYRMHKTVKGCGEYVIGEGFRITQGRLQSNSTCYGPQENPEGKHGACLPNTDIHPTTQHTDDCDASDIWSCRRWGRYALNPPGKPHAVE